uniref:SAM domain-containing protein n=1 Tax=Wuchereria bancrofti TaxID=6293 RepID=A0A1I8EGG5_WUCBA
MWFEGITESRCSELEFTEHQKFLYSNCPEPWINNLISGDFKRFGHVGSCAVTKIGNAAGHFDVLITANDEKLRDPEGYEAITQLHHQMDDDQSGSIDRFESTDVIKQQIFFLKEDMQLGGLDRAKREHAFHHNHDELITVDDLWEAWFACEERSWTTTDMVNWLENTVRLPQYASVFIGMEIDGRALPRMAVANSTYLLSDLGIKNSVHKQKLRLKALDVVLFGFSDGNASRLKDIALSVLVIVLVTVLFVLKMQRTRSHMQMEQLAAKLSQLKSMQSNFEDIQQKFEEGQKKRQSSRGAPENEQVETLKSQLMEAERLLENSGSAPLALQPLLRRTCELEVSYVGQQRMECIAEMREAIEHIDKLRKKQSSLVSSIKLATGASSGTDHIDSRIFALKARMEKISLAMSECHQRWTEIESLCGFPLVPTSVAAEIVFPSTVASNALPRSGSSSSFYRKSDLVGATVTASMASSSTSGNSPPAIIEDIRVRTSPPVCVCTYENFASAGALYVDSLNSQRDIHENGNASRPLKVVADSNKLLQHSSSSGFSKCRHIGPVTKIQTSRNQSIGPLTETVTDVISETPTVQARSKAIKTKCVKCNIQAFIEYQNKWICSD